MSDVVGKKFYNAEQPSSAFKLLNGGPSIALSGLPVGNDNLKDFIGLVVGTAGATTPKGFIRQATDTMSETVSVTVV